MLGLGVTVAVVSAALLALAFGVLGTDAFPRATAVLVPPIALMAMAGARWVYRAWKDRRTGIAGDARTRPDLRSRRRRLPVDPG